MSKRNGGVWLVAILAAAGGAGTGTGCATSKAASREPAAAGAAPTEESKRPADERDRGDEPATSVPEADAPGAPGRTGEGAGGSTFGLTRETAVNVCLPAGEKRYLSELRCPGGEAPAFARRGSVGPRTEGAGGIEDLEILMDAHRKLPPGMADGHVIDLYDVSCGRRNVEVFMDMYHCADPDPPRPVGPLRAPPAP